MGRKAFQFLGLQIVEANVRKISELRTQLALKTDTNNHYAVYRDTHNGEEKVYCNWRREHLEGKERAEALRLMNAKMPKD